MVEPRKASYPRERHSRKALAVRGSTDMLARSALYRGKQTTNLFGQEINLRQLQARPFLHLPCVEKLGRAGLCDDAQIQGRENLW